MKLPKTVMLSAATPLAEAADLMRIAAHPSLLRAPATRYTEAVAAMERPTARHHDRSVMRMKDTPTQDPANTSLDRLHSAPFRYVYRLHRPIDFWTGAVRLDDVPYGPDLRCFSDPSYYREMARAHNDFAAALDVLRRAVVARWEGNLREGPFALYVPGYDAMWVGAWALKQENNGTTFVVSRVPMPWLEGEDTDAEEVAPN